MLDSTPNLVSVHGGHSGQFCSHAEDTLEEIVRTYIDKGFAWFGITEHVPPLSDRFMFPEEIEEGLTAERMRSRFEEYFSVARDLQKRYTGSIRILVGFETEGYTGFEDHVTSLREHYKPDYIVGSVHHVHDIPIDGSKESYQEAIGLSGSIENLYCEYFDRQLILLDALSPEVVGHFDLIRIHDPGYPDRLETLEIKDRILRNLEKVRELGSILDFNVRAFEKGATEPYVAPSILELALDLAIPCVPGDDSHGVAGVGLHVQKGIAILKEHGFSTDWPTPGRIH